MNHKDGLIIILATLCCILFIISYEEIQSVFIEQRPLRAAMINVHQRRQSPDSEEATEEERKLERAKEEEETLSQLLNTNYTITTTSPEKMFQHCPLHRKDPWDDDFIKALGDASFTPCKPEDQLTTFKDSIISLNSKHPHAKEKTCEGRCLYYKSNYDLRADNFSPIEKHKFECDVVEVQCKNSSGRLEYKNLHTQILEVGPRDRKAMFKELYRETQGVKVTPARFHPNVYLVLWDAMAMTSAFRQMPETMLFLEENLQAVPFRFVSKVAENSKPNSIAFMFGEIPIAVDRRVFGVDKVLYHTLHETETCNRPLDNESYIMYEYEDAGYKTLWGSDYYLVNFGYTSCKGLVNQLATHYMRPFQIRAAVQNDALLKSIVFDPSKCRAPYHHLLDYQEKFWNAYKGTPKMSLIWSVDLSHDNEKDMAKSDKTFRAFFERNKHSFDDSIVIVMGDHGPRFAGTEQGLYDRNNPLMFVSLPRRLRETPMQRVLEQNSRLLSSHHDLHATLVDIVRHQPLSNFSDTAYLRINGTYGSSWLREFEAGAARNCRTLPIPSQYCLCDYGQREITDSALRKKIAQLAVRDINAHLKDRGVSDVCEEMQLDEVEKLFSIPSARYKHLYRLFFVSKRGARIDVSYVEDENGDLSILQKQYGSTADCLQNDAKNFDLRILCYCKNILKLIIG